MKRRVLVVDDEEGLRLILSLTLKRASYEVVTADNGIAALELVKTDPNIDIVLCDVRMPKLDGLGFLEQVKLLKPELPIVMMSAYGTTDTAIEAVKKGAYDFLSKPFKPDEVILTFRKLEEREALNNENIKLKQEVAQQRAKTSLIGSEQGLRRVVSVALKVAPSPVTILINGESGTGKEVLAKVIHEASGRTGQYVAINCGAIPEALLESELFGHERGAFTGAVNKRQGVFEQAHNGTLLLDEIAELPISLQVKLLRALETGVVRRLGAEQDTRCNTRIIAATAKVLAEEVEAGRFREDLYYRLNVVRITIPPLRERKEDITALITYFLQKHSKRMNRKIPRVNPRVMQILESFSWPGNVRQLENACERAVLLSEGDIEPEDLPPEIFKVETGDMPMIQGLSIKENLSRLEKELIIQALEHTEGNKTQAAKLLEISYKALMYKIKDYGIET